MKTWQELIEKDLEWRKGELAALKLKLLDAKPQAGEPQSAGFKVLLKAAWTMLYSHYEGFCLFLFTRYLDRIEGMKVTRGDCREPLIRASLQQHLPKIRNKPENDFCVFLAHGYSLLLREPIEFPRDKKLKGEFELQGRSNLWPKLLDECCQKFGIVCAQLGPADTRLKLLVARRNTIAHGKEAPVKDYDEYDEYETHVFLVLDSLAEAFQNAVATCAYLEPAAKHRETQQIAYRIWSEAGGEPLDNWFEAERRLANGETA